MLLLRLLDKQEFQNEPMLHGFAALLHIKSLHSHNNLQSRKRVLELFEQCIALATPNDRIDVFVLKYADFLLSIGRGDYVPTLMLSYARQCPTSPAAVTMCFHAHRIAFHARRAAARRRRREGLFSFQHHVDDSSEDDDEDDDEDDVHDRGSDGDGGEDDQSQRGDGGTEARRGQRKRRYEQLVHGWWGA